jgi:hypothetical protein
MQPKNVGICLTTATKEPKNLIRSRKLEIVTKDASLPWSHNRQHGSLPWPIIRLVYPRNIPWISHLTKSLGSKNLKKKNEGGFPRRLITRE